MSAKSVHFCQQNDPEHNKLLSIRHCKTFGAEASGTERLFIFTIVLILILFKRVWFSNPGHAKDIADQQERK